ncbi:S46 family peptidase [Nemorincola caseinilytica]|uniref:Dipeptidyl-peptidase n=2 Tax=Nemorincola caseinilytica TaxID=2054315 RepID=A0ABP8NHT6_9BACT
MTAFPTHAKEGMWLPPNLKNQERDMKAAGLQIAIDKIYNENGTGLNNAIVLFGKGCTGEVISPKGLILTNHHCGYGSAQALSSPEKDYFANGFWAKSMAEELPCKGLTVTFIRRIENVTQRILDGVADTLRDAVRDSIVNARVAAAEKEMAKTTGMDVLIKPYFKGNEFWAAISETFRDIRFVGFPPNGIGAFGGDVENWMWPRHTGDFSIFRVYAGPDNKPADHSANNRPYEAPQYFTINANGYKEGDMTMVYGFPGTTNQYISSFALKHVYNIMDPISIEARTRKLDIWTKYMNNDRDIFLKYTAKRATVANGWKKWQGEVVGLKLNNATGKKQAYEATFRKWAEADNTLPWADVLLPRMQIAAEGADKVVAEEQYIKEAVLGIELVQQAGIAEKLVAVMRSKLSADTVKDSLGKLVAAQEAFYKNYDANTDKDVFKTLMALYFEKNSASLPEYYTTAYRAHGQDMGKWADDIYTSSVMVSQDRLKAWAAQPDSAKLQNDAAYRLYDAISRMRKQRIQPALTVYNTDMRFYERLYMKARMAHDKKREFYPDANLTLRLTYGHVKGLDPDGPAKYAYQTTLGEVVALDDTASDVFKVPAKLKELYERKDYGRWGVNGVMPVAFVASNHTSGGNSGSPVLNARGELIGTNFDRAYEGTMSDYYFDPNRCRNISVDIRYTLFVIEKFGDAGWLIDEMKIIKNKPAPKK